MKHLSQLRAKLAKVAPFVVYQLFGTNNQLAIKPATDLPIVPISISCAPPDITFILESGIVTDLIGRYSKTYQNNLKRIKEPGVSQDEKTEFMSTSLQEVREEIEKIDESPMEMIALITKVGKAFLISKALKGWYEVDGFRDKFDILFTDNKEEADDFNKEAEKEDIDSLYIWTGVLDASELFNIASQFQSMIMDSLDDEVSKPLIANIPVLAEDGEVLTIPADRVATFPRSTRNLTVEDVSRTGGE